MNLRWVTMMMAGAGVVLMPCGATAGTWRIDKTCRLEAGTWETGPEIGHDYDGGGINPGNDVDFPGWGFETIGTVSRSFSGGFNGFDAWKDTGVTNPQIRYRSNLAPASNDPNWSIGGSGKMVFEWHLWVDSGCTSPFCPEIRMGNGYKLGVSYEASTERWVASNEATLPTPAPMTADEWHVVRLEYAPNAGSFTLMIDSPTNTYTGGVGSSSAAYIWWGRILNGGTGTFYTHYSVWGQGTDQIGEMGSLVPEPGSLMLALVVLAAIQFLRRGRR